MGRGESENKGRVRRKGNVCFRGCPQQPVSNTQWDLSLAGLCLPPRTALVVDFRTLESAQSHLVNSVNFCVLIISILEHYKMRL